MVLSGWYTIWLGKWRFARNDADRESLGPKSLTNPKSQRRLAAVLAADVVGYSRLIRADEDATLARLRALRCDLIEPKITEHGGRVVKLMGDGLLAEFPSAVAAVSMAVETQIGVGLWDRELPEDQRLLLRIGVNLGDVVVDGDDIHGDGVNLAARLEALADPGGICIAENVYDQVRDRTNHRFEARGEQLVKNIDRPIRVWQWNAAKAPPTRAPAAELALPDKPSIAVLAFDNMSNESEHDFFADGIAEDIITALSRIDAFFVVARNSSFTYKGRAVDVQQVGRELGVRYVLEGSVRTAGTRMRVTAQLIDALSGRHVWAEKYDRNIEDLFDIQDEITRNVVACTQIEILISEASLFEGIEEPSLPVWGLVCRAQRCISAGLSAESFVEGIRLTEQALALDASSGRAHQMMSFLRFHHMWMGFAENPDEELRKARHHAERAVQLNNRDESAYWILGMVRLFDREHESAIAAMEKAIDINPNYSRGYGSLATVLNFAGDPKRAIEMNRIALRSNPIDPGNIFRYCGLSMSYVLLGAYDAALENARRIMQTNPDWYMSHVMLIVALEGAGQSDAARRAVASLRSQLPAFSITQLERLPFRHSDDLARVAEPFKRAFEMA